MTTLYDLIQVLESYAPRETALPGDKPGVQLGVLDPSRQKQVKIKNVALAVAPSAAVIVKACQQKANVLITHLPLFTGPITEFSEELLNQIRLALRDNLFLYAVPSNWIGSENGVAESVGSLLGLQIDRLFQVSRDGKSYTTGRYCQPKRSMTLEILVRTVAERFQRQYIEYSGRSTHEIERILVLPFDAPPIGWISKAANEQADTILSGALPLEHQVLAHELHLNIIQVPRLGMAYIGMRRLLQLIQLQQADLDLFLIDEEYQAKPLFFL